MCGTLLGEVGRAAVSAEAHPANASANAFFVFFFVFLVKDTKHTRSGRVMMMTMRETMRDDDDTVRSVSGRSFALLGSSTCRACDEDAFRGRPEGSPGSPRGRRVTRAGRVERRSSSSRRKRRVRRDWTWLAALTQRIPRRRTRPRRRARRMRPNPVSPYPSPCLAVSVSAPPGGARTSADGAAVKNFFSKAREHRRLPEGMDRLWLPQ